MLWNVAVVLWRHRHWYDHGCKTGIGFWHNVDEYDMKITSSPDLALSRAGVGL